MVARVKVPAVPVWVIYVIELNQHTAARRAPSYGSFAGVAMRYGDDLSSHFSSPAFSPFEKIAV